MSERYDAIVVGAGPNGLAAAVEMARHGRSVLVVEGAAEIGGGTRTEELTLPGFLHDVCSAVHPLGAGSPFFRSLPLGRYGLEWIHPDVAMTHPLPDGDVVALHRSLVATAIGLGRDADRYRRHMGALVEHIDDLLAQVLAPLLRVPRHPITLARFGLPAMLPATLLASTYREPRTRALLAGIAAHSVTALNRPLTSAIALLLGAAGHCFGWPIARGGSAAIARALAQYLESLGGRVVTGQTVESLDDLPPADRYLLDVMPTAAARIGGARVTKARSRLTSWKHGPPSFKVDWALDRPIPWTDPLSRRAGTVHVGGTYKQVVVAESAVWKGRDTQQPFVLLSQPTIVDPSRAPAGHHTAWGYCHVPRGFTGDRTAAIEAQIERFAPGFRDTIVARHTMGPADLEAHNPNYVGGDIGGGAFTTRQVVARPRFARDPYRIGEQVYLCSSATPPGAGVHGMSGYWAARSALRAG
ncbi:MAG: NAD(P)/FAD-dependent oxidoreductase [Acidimicrobiia bacterium]|nr:NAD(P)/FAD-dependent oxidoreductase [Acidimicrobiia bacterium]